MKRSRFVHLGFIPSPRDTWPGRFRGRVDVLVFHIVNAHITPFVSFPQVLIGLFSTGMVGDWSIKDSHFNLIPYTARQYSCRRPWVPLSQTFWAESDRGDARVREQKDDGTICKIGGERQRRRVTEGGWNLHVSHGDWRHHLHKQWGGGWQHLLHDECVCEGCPHTTKWHFESSSRPGRIRTATRTKHIQTHIHSQRDFTSHFPAPCRMKCAITSGGEATRGHFVRGVYALFVNQYTSTQSGEINAGVRIRMSTSGTHV